jgi:hypothetical protein
VKGVWYKDPTKNHACHADRRGSIEPNHTTPQGAFSIFCVLAICQPLCHPHPTGYPKREIKQGEQMEKWKKKILKIKRMQNNNDNNNNNNNNIWGMDGKGEESS